MRTVWSSAIYNYLSGKFVLCSGWKPLAQFACTLITVIITEYKKTNILQQNRVLSRKLKIFSQNKKKFIFYQYLLLGEKSNCFIILVCNLDPNKIYTS